MVSCSSSPAGTSSQQRVWREPRPCGARLSPRATALPKVTGSCLSTRPGQRPDSGRLRRRERAAVPRAPRGRRGGEICHSGNPRTGRGVVSSRAATEPSKGGTHGTVAPQHGLQSAASTRRQRRASASLASAPARSATVARRSVVTDPTYRVQPSSWPYSSRRHHRPAMPWRRRLSRWAAVGQSKRR